MPAEDGEHDDPGCVRLFLGWRSKQCVCLFLSYCFACQLFQFLRHLRLLMMRAPLHTPGTSVVPAGLLRPRRNSEAFIELFQDKVVPASPALMGSSVPGRVGSPVRGAQSLRSGLKTVEILQRLDRHHVRFERWSDLLDIVQVVQVMRMSERPTPAWRAERAARKAKLLRSDQEHSSETLFESSDEEDDDDAGAFGHMTWGQARRLVSANERLRAQLIAFFKTHIAVDLYDPREYVFSLLRL